MYLNNPNNHYLSAGQIEVLPLRNRNREGQEFIILSPKGQNLSGMAELVNRLMEMEIPFEISYFHTEEDKIWGAQIPLGTFEEKVGPYITQEKEDRSYLLTL
jgi:hypothetical protein